MSQSTNPFTTATGKSPSCMEMLQLMLDGEVSSEQEAYFKAHMDQCMPCFKSHEVDMAIKQLVKDRCCGDGAPLELLQEIKHRMSQREK
ncbi:MAG: mycothiol system anti-sigma-R factor [Cytophagales bacterium]|nr:mycothiol system anti-sigma-R factor [Cytophagales bacterium]